MRAPGFALCILLAAGSAKADPSSIESLMSSIEGGAEFQLGGAATRAAIVPEAASPTKLHQPRLRLSVPRLFREKGETIRKTAFGALSVIVGEGWNNGQDVFHLGTAITRGQTTAGVSVTYETDAEMLEGSELYIDYALTDAFSVGISGMLNDDVTTATGRVPQLGLNAEISAPGGAFLQGGITDAPESEPVFGVAVGLRF